MAETEAGRVARIFGEVQGGRSLDAVRRSVNLQAGLPAEYGITAGNTAAEQSRMGDALWVQDRIRSIFSNRGVRISTTSPDDTRPAAAPASGVDNALAYIEGVLDQYGLGSLSGWAFEQLQAGRSADRILIDLRQRPEFLQRFPAIAARQAAGLAPISPNEYVAYEQQARQILQQFGFPEGFIDEAKDFTALITGDVSVAELYERAQQGFNEVANAPEVVRDAFSAFFGAQGTAAIAAMYVDPGKAAPVLKQMATEARIGGAAREQDIMADLATARKLREAGVTADQALAGFRQVRALDPLFAESVGESTDFTAEGVGTNAVFGLDATDARRLERRRLQRTADFSGAGGAATGQRGIAGLGVDEGAI